MAVSATDSVGGAAEASERADQSALPVNRYAVFFALAVVGCSADLATKSWIFGRLGMPGASPTSWIWDGVFGFQTSLNQGALFGLGKGHVWVFAALSILVLPAIVYWLFAARAARDLLLTIALGLVTAGILGNLYDRLGLHGLTWTSGEPVHAVRDWILVMIGSFHWPNFNLADSMLVCGSILLVWHAFRHDAGGKSDRSTKP